MIIYIIIATTFLPVLSYFIILATRRKSHFNDSNLKSIPRNISIILPCFNEEKHIQRKVEELIKESHSFNDYEIIIIDDGSTDTSRKIILNLASYNKIKTILLNKRKGKSNALNLGVVSSKFPTIIFTDARQTITKGSILRLIRHFKYPQVGAVSAMLINETKKCSIRSIVNFLKQAESNSGSTIGVYGALYAIRKSCYSEIPPETILDDLLIPINVIIQNKEVKFEPKAKVIDININSFYSNKRPFRITTGLIQFLKSNSNLIKRLPFKYKIYLYSQKYFKLILPIVIIISLSQLSIVKILYCIPFFIIVGLIIGMNESLLLSRIYANLIWIFIRREKINNKWNKPI